MAKKRETHTPHGAFRERSKHRRNIPHKSSVRSRREGSYFPLSLGGNQLAYNTRNLGNQKKENVA